MESSVTGTAVQSDPADQGDETLLGATQLDPSIPPWTTKRAYWLAAALLAVLLCTLIPLVSTGAIAFPDEGVYSAQAKNLAEDSSWSSPRPAPDLDIDGSLDAIGPTHVIGERSIPYARHPAYPLTLSLAYRFAGAGGLIAVSVFGTWAAAVVSGAIARRIDPRYGIPAMWLTGIGTPLLFGGYLVMAHSIAAACAALLLYSICKAVDDGRWAYLALASASTAALVGFRSEGLVVALAVGCVLGIQSLSLVRKRPRIRAQPAVAALVVVATAVTSYLLESSWVRSITSGSGDGRGAAEIVGDRTDPLRAVGIGLLQPWHDGLDAIPPAALTLMGIFLAAVALRVAPSRPLFALAALSGATASAVWLQFAAPTLIAGLLPAFPVALFAWIFLRWRDSSSRLAVRLVGVQAISVVLLAITIYGDGGATQWGGRFFYVLIPAIVPLAVLGLHRSLLCLARSHAVFVCVCIVATTLSLSVISLRINHELRQTTQSFVTSATEVSGDLDNAGHRTLLVMSEFGGGGSSRAFWDQRDQIELLRTRDIRELFPLIEVASSNDWDRVLVLSNRDATTLGFFEEEHLATAGWSILDEREIRESGYHLLTYGPADG